MQTKPLDLASTFVVLDPDLAAEPVNVTATIFEELEERYEGFSGHLLVSSFSFDTNWSTWELHPAGDEIVVLLGGEAEMVIDEAGEEVAYRLTEPGQYVIVPRNSWHTGRTASSATVVLITPGEGTANEPI